MKHNERARVAPLYLTSTHPFRTQKKMQRAHHALALRLGVWFACSLWSAFSGLARSAHLDPSACSLNARGARSLTNSALLPELARCASFLKSLVFAANSLWGGAPRRLSRPRENPQQKRETREIKRALFVGDQALLAFKEQALGSRRAERASPEKADCSEQANQAPSQEVSAWCARCVFFLHERDM